MNQLILVRTQPLEQALAYNQATVATFSQATIDGFNQARIAARDEAITGDVRLIVELGVIDTRVQDAAVFGYVNEVGVITQIASLDDIAEACGLEGGEDIREFSGVTRGLVEALI